MSRDFVRRFTSSWSASSLLLAFPVQASSPEGSWNGRIDVSWKPDRDLGDPGTASGGEMVGEIDIPAQGLKDFPLAEVEVDGTSVSFAMPGIPGKPRFRGTLSADGSGLDGEFSQGGAHMPFHLERKGEAEIRSQSKVEAIPDSMASRLAGRWAGTLNAPGKPLRLVLVLKPDPATGLTATLDSPDQGRSGMPVSRLTVNGSTVRAELGYAGAAFEGVLDSDGSEISGVWRQGGGSMPLSLRKEAAANDAPFPRPTRRVWECQPRAMEILDHRVQKMVDDEEIVGGELIVIKDRRTVFRKAFGWKDRETNEPMKVDAVYCVRSMTKPLVGTAIQMLIDEGRLRLDTPVREILPFFDGPEKGTITVEHLLTHTSGTPVHDDRQSPLRIPRPRGRLRRGSFQGAAVRARAPVSSTAMPGPTRSARSSRRSAACRQSSSSRQRILDPLGMQETFTLLDGDEAVLSRIPSAYSGEPAHGRDTGNPPILPSSRSS